MKTLFSGLILLLMTTQFIWGQQNTSTPTVLNYTKAEQEIITLSKDKWQWMAHRDEVAGALGGLDAGEACDFEWIALGVLWKRG